MRMIDMHETLDSIKKTFPLFTTFPYIVFPFHTAPTPEGMFSIFDAVFRLRSKHGSTQHAKQYLLWIVYGFVFKIPSKFSGVYDDLFKPQYEDDKKKHLLNRTCPWTGAFFFFFFLLKWFPIMNNCSDWFEVIELA